MSSNEYAFESSLEHSSSAEAFGFGVSLEVEAAYSESGSSEFKSVQKLYQEKQVHESFLSHYTLGQVSNLSGFLFSRFFRG